MMTNQRTRGSALNAVSPLHGIVSPQFDRTASEPALISVHDTERANRVPVSLDRLAT